MSAMINIDFRDRRPIYEQLVDAVKEQIMRGILAEDEQLPSVRALAAELGINPNTIQKAYSELERQGVTYTVSGKGGFVANTKGKILESKKLDITKRLQAIAHEAKALGIEFNVLEDALREGYYGGETQK